MGKAAKAVAHKRRGGGQQHDVAPGRTSDERLPLIFIQFVLTVVTLMIYVQTSTFGFIELDDDVYMARNPMVRKGLTSESIGWAFTTFETGNWHPLTWLSLLLDVELFDSPGGPHMVNVLLHILNALLVFHIFNRMTGHPWRSALVAALFAVHPLHVESVAWISERKDVLSSFLGSLSIMAYVNWTRHGRRKEYVLTCLFLGLGLLAKPMLVTVPLLLLILDAWPLGRWDRPGSTKWSTSWHLFKEKIPLFMMVVAAAILAIISQRAEHTMATLEDLSFSRRLGNACIAYVGYLWHFIWPADLAVLYPLPKDALPWWRQVAALATLAAISFLVARKTRRYPFLAAGWLWFLITLVPVIGIVQVGHQSMADRYTYIPSIGIFIIVSWGAWELAERYRSIRTWIIIAFVVVIGALSIAAWEQVRLWRDTRSLFDHTLAVTSANRLIHLNYGVMLAGAGDHLEAIDHYGQALEVWPTQFVTLVYMGVSQAALGRHDRAVAYFTKGLSIHPDNIELRLKLSASLSQMGRHNEALTILKKALELDENNAAVRSSLGLLFLYGKDVNAAKEQLDRAVKLDPRNAQAWNNLGLVYVTEMKYEMARDHFEHALQVDPDYINARNNLKGVEMEMAARDTARASP